MVLNPVSLRCHKEAHIEMKQIEGVVMRPFPLDPSWSNSRPARDLVCLINGDPDILRYFGLQIKELTLHTPDYLGKLGHYHNYAELYFVREGEVTFDLWDKGADAKQRAVVPKGSLLLIPPGVAHRAYGPAGLVMLAVTSQPFRPGSDIPADFEPVGPLPYGLE